MGKKLHGDEKEGMDEGGTERIKRKEEVAEWCPIVSNEGSGHEAPAITDRFRRSLPPTSHLSATQPLGHPPA